jgi:hypothetical protein
VEPCSWFSTASFVYCVALSCAQIHSHRLPVGVRCTLFRVLDDHRFGQPGDIHLSPNSISITGR